MSRKKITLRRTLRPGKEPYVNDLHSMETIYTVIKTVNTLQVEIGQELSPKEVRDMIKDGYTEPVYALDVTIVGTPAGVGL